MIWGFGVSVESKVQNGPLISTLIRALVISGAVASIASGSPRQPVGAILASNASRYHPAAAGPPPLPLGTFPKGKHRNPPASILKPGAVFAAAVVMVRLLEILARHERQ